MNQRERRYESVSEDDSEPEFFFDEGDLNEFLSSNDFDDSDEIDNPLEVDEENSYDIEFEKSSSNPLECFEVDLDFESDSDDESDFDAEDRTDNDDDWSWDEALEDHWHHRRLKNMISKSNGKTLSQHST